MTYVRGLLMTSMMQVRAFASEKTRLESWYWVRLSIPVAFLCVACVARQSSSHFYQQVWWLMLLAPVGPALLAQVVACIASLCVQPMLLLRAVACAAACVVARVTACVTGPSGGLCNRPEWWPM